MREAERYIASAGRANLVPRSLVDETDDRGGRYFPHLLSFKGTTRSLWETIGTLRNNDDHGNGNVKKQWV